MDCGMNNLWLVEQGERLRGLSANRPTANGIRRAGLSQCSIRLSPVEPRQLALSADIEAGSFNLVRECVQVGETKRANDERQGELKI